MAFGKNIGLQGMRYKGGGPMLTFLLHRITALGIILFVGLHVLASFAMQQLGSEWGTTLNIIYEHWIFQLFVVFCVIFHTLNGLRITILDFWPQLLKYQREATWLQWFVFFPVYGLTIFIIIQRGILGS